MGNVRANMVNRERRLTNTVIPDFLIPKPPTVQKGTK